MDLAAAVRAEQIRALYRQSPLVLWTNVVIASLASAALWHATSQRALVSWVALMAVIALLRGALMRHVQETPPRQAPFDASGRLFVAGSIVAGAGWGLGIVLFFTPGNEVSQIVLTFAIGGMTAAAAGTWASHPPAFWGYFIASVGPLLVRTFALGDTAHLAMGSMLFAYTAGMARVVSTNHQTLTQAFRLGLENTELLARLSASRANLEETNRTLERRVVQRTAALERQAEALRDAQRLEVVGRLAGGIAHDFNNLLTIVLTNVDILEETQRFDAAGGAAVEETLTAARRGADLIRQLLAFSRRQRIEPRVLDCNRVVGEMDRLLYRLAGERVEVRVSLHREPLHVIADPSQLEQILVNLVANARDAMPEGGQLRISTELVQQLPSAPSTPNVPSTPTTAITSEATGKFALLRVEDDGVGMDAETLRRVFDPFFSTKPPGRGSGLGLATVHGIVQQNGGRVLVNSELGFGSQFSVYLPITDQPAVARTESPPPTHTPALPFRTATILVAEDEPTLRSVIRRSLSRLGHTVLVAEDGARALQVAASHTQTIDLLVTDVVMPNLNGAELARRLSSQRPGIAVLFISGYSWGESLPASDLTEGVAYLQKPFDTRALEACVAELLSMKFSQHERVGETELTLG
jgi:signal transduction histidine kinase/ActR/RegA family two-component response regulator